MALKKKITKSNGIELEYHRIALLTIETNQQITILIRSYLNEEGREYEKKYAAGEIESEPTFPYTVGEYMHFDYDDNMNITNAYNLLKSLPEFEGAEDV